MLVRLLNQPDDHQLGILLKQLLGIPELLKFDALVAFAVSSGVEHLQVELESLLARGGRVRIVVGVSNRVTTTEGLQLLLELVNKGAEVFVFHNDIYSNPIFHPKLYLFQEKHSGALIVGSSNMTGKGLVGNYEISAMHELDLKNKPDSELVASAERIVAKYCDVNGGLSHPLDAKLLQELEAEGYLGSEQAATSRSETSGESETATTAPRKKLFASKAVPQPATRRAAAAKGKPTVAATPAAPAALVAPAAAAVRRGALLWKKTLAASDVQSQTGHPTGVVRLTQARWRVGTRLIDWTTYFRRNLFGGFNWRITKQKPLVEETDIQFNITILGVSVGVHRLKVSDKPSGEAGQRNYTSSLHWGDLANNIRKARLAGKTLRLYGPPTGSNEPFFIEIS